VLPEGTTFPGELPIDVPFEASKLPLDVAVFNSARGASENALAPLVAKFLENVLLVGGGSLVPGLAHMLQQRCVLFVTPGPDASFIGQASSHCTVILRCRVRKNHCSTDTQGA
jgi:hypothetical protein